MYYAETVDALAEKILNSLAQHAVDWTCIEFGIQPCSSDAFGWAMDSSEWSDVSSEIECPEQRLADLPTEFRPVLVKYRMANNDCCDIGRNAVREDLRSAKLQNLNDGCRFDFADDERIVLYAPMGRFMQSREDASDVEFFVGIRCARPEVNQNVIWQAMYRIKSFSDNSGGRMKTSIPSEYLASVMFRAARDDAGLY